MRQFSRIFLTGLALVPGLAHIYRHHCAKGIILFALFAFFANTFLVAPWVLAQDQSGPVRTGSALLAAATWCYSLIDLRRISHE